MRPFVLCVLGLSLVASVSMAAPPDPANCLCGLDMTGRLYMAPDYYGTAPHPQGAFDVEVRDAAGALIAPAWVRVNISGLGGGFTFLCPGAITTKTTPTGIVMFNIPGGGCLKHRPGAVTIEAHDGSGSWVTIRTYPHIMSSDYAQWDDFGIPNMWDRCVTPVDLAAFVACYWGGGGGPCCHEYDNDGICGPTDLAVFVMAYFGGTNCC